LVPTEAWAGVFKSAVSLGLPETVKALTQHECFNQINEISENDFNKVLGLPYDMQYDMNEIAAGNKRAPDPVIKPAVRTQLPPSQSVGARGPEGEIGKEGQSNDTVILQVVGSEGQPKAEINVELADTFEKRRVGLSNRLCLPEGYGMFFDKVGAYWMKDVNFPLDIVFLDEKGTILEKQHMQRLEKDAEIIPRYIPSHREAAYSLELPAGWFEKKGLQAGDRIRAIKLHFYRQA
jgi:uncharacterized membrane protein (UPF0127 family)